MKYSVSIISLIVYLITFPSHAIQVRSNNVSNYNKSIQSLLAPPTPGFHLTNGNTDLLISGQVNQDMFYVYDGERGRVFYGDNDVSASTLRFTTTRKLSDCFNTFTIIELGIQDRSSREVSQLDPTPNNIFNLRIGEAGLNFKYFGKLSLGQGYTATDYTAEVDLSGVEVVENSAIQKMGGNIFFSSAADGSLVGNPTIHDVFDNLDGLSRRTRLRYDTPEFKGFTLSTSVIERSNVDGAIRYHKEGQLFKFAAAIGLASSSLILDTNNVPGRNLDGSASLLLLESMIKGLNATVAGGEVFAKENGRKNPNYGYAKLGYQLDYFCIGKTNFGIDFEKSKNYDQNDDLGKVYGGAVTQNLTPWNTSLYLAVRHFTLNHSSEKFNPINLIVGGIRIIF